MAKLAHMDVSRGAAAVVREMAGRFGPLYVADCLLPQFGQQASLEVARAALLDPQECLRAFLKHYAFARRGKERQPLADLALGAFRRYAHANPDFLRHPDAVPLWRAFEEVCAERRQRPLEQLNRGVIQGVAELAQEIAREGGSGSIAAWLVDAVRATSRLESLFLRMVDVRGVGPKITSLFVRDVACLFELETALDPVDRLYLQPIDKWTRAVSRVVVEDYDDPADWILAGKLAKVARKVGVSGVHFNMGVSYFGMRVARTPESFERLIAEIAEGAFIPTQAAVRPLESH